MTALFFLSKMFENQCVGFKSFSGDFKFSSKVTSGCSCSVSALISNGCFQKKVLWSDETMV